MVIDSYICQFICKSCIFILSFPKQREFFLYLFSRDTGIVDGYLELAVCRDTGFAISEIINNKQIISILEAICCTSLLHEVLLSKLYLSTYLLS